jgi:tetratricopeptide (TPR) repeat protein
MTMRAARRLAPLAFVLLLSGPAVASSPAADPATVAREALQEFQQGHWAEALALFEASFQMRPSAKVQRAIAKCLFEMRMYARAIAACDRALEDARDPLPDDLAADVRSLRSRALGFTNEVVIEVKPGHAEVALDGQRTPLSRRLELGTHAIRIEAAGYEPQVTHFELVSGEPLKLRFELHRNAPEPERPSLLFPLGGTVAAAVATAAGAIYAAERSGSVDDCEELRSRGSGCRNTTELERERTIGLVVTTVSAATLVACGYLLVRALSGSPRPSRTAMEQALWRLPF